MLQQVKKSEQQLYKSLDFFKDNLEQILNKYSLQLQEYNRNERQYEDIVSQNRALRSERDELLLLLAQMKSEMQKKQLDR